MRAAIRTILVTALAVGLFAFFLRNANLAEVWTRLQTAHPGWLAFSLALTFSMYFVRTERWQYLLAPLGRTRYWIAFRATVIGFAASFVLPARAGSEVLRPYLLARQEGLPATATFATIIVERMLDLIAVLMLLASYFLWFGDSAQAAAPALYRTVAIGGAALFPVGLAMIGVMFVMAGHPERLHAIVLKIERVLPPRLAQAVARFARTFAEGLAVVRNPQRLLLALAWSVLLWLLIAAQIWAVALAFGIALPFTGSFVVTAMLVVGVSVPTPGGMGAVHEALRLGVTAFYGADNDAAVGAALVQHAANFIPITLLGAWFAAQDGLTFGRLRTIAGEAKEKP